jgi:hypothetical protein
MLPTVVQRMLPVGLCKVIWISTLDPAFPHLLGNLQIRGIDYLSTESPVSRGENAQRLATAAAC